MAKHLPGPWVVENVNSDFLHDICLGYPVSRSGNPVLVATVFHDEDGYPISPRQADANARLIAAAPDLLAACEAVLSSPTYGDTPSEAAAALARQAVAKARGGAA